MVSILKFQILFEVSLALFEMTLFLPEDQFRRNTSKETNPFCCTLHSATSCFQGPRLFGDEGGELDMGKLALFRTLENEVAMGMEIKGLKGDKR